MKRIAFWTVALSGILVGTMRAQAELHPGIQGLNEILIQKGIITKEEVEAQAKKHSVNVTGYLQIQGNVIENDDAMGFDGKGGTTRNTPLADEDGFKIRRAKIAVSGYAYEHVKFKVEADLAGSSPRLDDAFIEDDHLPYLVGRVGQFKIPFSLEMLTSDSEILTIERSEVANQIAPERDTGISFSGNISDGILQYSIGAFNGHLPSGATTYKVGSFANAGRNASSDNDQLLYAGRLVVKPFKWLHLGVAGLTSEDGEGAKRIEHSAYGSELQVKLSDIGFSLQGECMRQRIEETKAGGVTIDSDGFYIQAGQFVVPKHLEIAVKYEGYDADDDVRDQDDIRWITVGLNYYIYGHDAKLMTNYIVKEERHNHYDNDTLRMQLQLRF